MMQHMKSYYNMKPNEGHVATHLRTTVYFNISHCVNIIQEYLHNNNNTYDK